MNLVIDIGSTSSKAALFFEGEMINYYRDLQNEDLKDLANLIITKNIIVSALGYTKEQIQTIIDKDFLFLDATIKLPFINKYETPETLGADRLALAAGANAMFPKEDVLVIDAGTCITYELINSKNEYLGGAIAPGFSLRLKSMYEHTRTLPLIEDYYSKPIDLIGKTTNACMLSGVVNGVKHEILETINVYKIKYPSLKAVICGGDVNLFESIVKDGIFAHPNFLFVGLNRILEYNVANK